MQIEVRDNSEAEHFEASEEGSVLGVLKYERRGHRLELLHTVTDPEQRGRGVASALATRAFEEARGRGERVFVVCPFVHSWLSRHPDQSDIVVTE